MRKQAPSLEWHIVESDDEWERQRARLALEVAPATGHRLRLKRYLWSVAALLLLLAGVGVSWRRATQASLHTNVAEPHRTVQQDILAVVQPDNPLATGDKAQTGMDWWLQHAAEYSSLRAAIQSADPEAHLDIAGHTIGIQGDQAVAQVVSHNESVMPAYRQTRFYQRIPEGWQQTPPDAALWGAQRSLTTPYFVYHFGEKDTAAVQAVAPQLDALYTTLWHNFGLPILPTPEKLIINVRVTQPPGQTTTFDRANQVSVASPALYLAPVELTDAELLAQSLALPLLAHVVAQARTHHAIRQSWQPLLDGLYLWQLWDTDLPLSTWRETVVKWQYIDLPATQPGQAFPLPKRYQELCADHKLWLPSLVRIHFPLVCAGRDWEDKNWDPWRAGGPLNRLEQLLKPARTWDGGVASLIGPSFSSSHPGQTVALATLTEYIVTTYGRNRLPALVAGLGHYDRWETLLPAVFGVSAAEFEAGWQAYLTAHYGIVVAYH